MADHRISKGGAQSRQEGTRGECLCERGNSSRAQQGRPVPPTPPHVVTPSKEVTMPPTFEISMGRFWNLAEQSYMDELTQLVGDSGFVEPPYKSTINIEAPIGQLAMGKSLLSLENPQLEGDAPGACKSASVGAEHMRTTTTQLGSPTIENNRRTSYPTMVTDSLCCGNANTGTPLIEQNRKLGMLSLLLEARISMLPLDISMDLGDPSDQNQLVFSSELSPTSQDPTCFVEAVPGDCRNIQEDVSVAAETSNGDDQCSAESPSGEKMKREAFEFESESRKELVATDAVDVGKSDQGCSSNGHVQEKADNSKDDFRSDQDLTLALYETSSIRTTSSMLSSTGEEVPINPPGSHVDDQVEVLTNGKVESPELRRNHIVMGEHEVKSNSILGENNLFRFGTRSQEISLQKAAAKASVIQAGSELSIFSDTPGDASLDDLFHPFDKNQEDQAAEASTSASSSHMNQGNALVTDAGQNDLVRELKARMAQKRIENGTRQTNGGDLFRLMMGVLREDVIDIDSLVFDEKLPGEKLFPLQAVEFSRLVGSLRPEEPEDVIVSASQKLIDFFRERPEQKLVFITQHGLLPLMELLEVPKTNVISSVLQIINQIIKDNTDFQENACLVGLVSGSGIDFKMYSQIPVVMSFAVPDRPREVRMQAAYFLQQLCQSSSLTLQMFIACRGIPVLVGFLEADYAKFREMVHLAIDGIWQVFLLQRSTPRNDFCRIAAKNGILIRLINTLHSLNEATRLACISGGGGFPVDGSAPRPQSGPLDSIHPISIHFETPISFSEQPDLLKVRHGVIDHPLSTGTLEPSRSSASNSQRSDVNQPDSRYFLGDADKPQATNAVIEASVASNLVEPTGTENVGHLETKEPAKTTSKDWEHLDLRKPDSSRAEVNLLRQQRVSTGNRISTDKPLKPMEIVSNGFPIAVASQQTQVRPLLSLLEKEPPSRHYSGQLDYVRNLSGLERHETILPLLHASTERKTHGELDFLMEEFAEVSGCGRENGNLDSIPRISHKTVNKKVGPLTSNEGAASTSGIASQTASGVLSGSGVLNARPGSATSSGLLSHMVSTLNTDVAREYLEKVADLLLEFARADTTVKSYMCSQSLLSRLFQMFNRIEPPILLKLLKCINHLSTDPNCLENLQRADAIKHLIPNLELLEGPLISQIHTEVSLIDLLLFCLQ
ncbi:hypothetical protein HHK36_006595 [Tetracentron sinense]|uniref:Uncharacterized protein n=1 Tax=Tetracentron sinense TaxID=13715 RepID=A0A835DPB4_TETSI|nr:hypothetical protein HHK36_006595 [Tetracentron sinense]